MTAVIRTVGGDLAAGSAGPVYCHEHLIIDTPLVAETMPQIHLHSIDEAVAEVRPCVAAGVRTMVDAMPAGSGRDPERLARVSVLTGMRIVAATGLHTDKYYPDVDWTRSETPEQLAARFIADIAEGIDRHDYRGETIERTAARAGLVKAAAATEVLTPRDERLFEAAALTSAATGAPILTHTEGGKGGLGQIEKLLSSGVVPERIALSHTDKIDDRGYHRALLETGALLCYDQGIRDPDTTFGLVDDMVADGHADRLLLGTDGARRDLWATLGGAPGLASLYRLARDRFEPELVHQLFVVNPASYLSLVA